MSLVPQKVSDVQMAFPGNVDNLLPAWDDIPEEFKNLDGTNQWYAMAYRMMYGPFKGLRVTSKDNIDVEDAIRQLHAIVGSHVPKHEHKMAGVAYLASEFFDVVEIDDVE